MISLTDSLLEVALSEIPDISQKKVAIKSLENYDINWFFEDRLIELLKRRGIAHTLVDDERKFLGDSTVSNNSVILEYRISKLAIEYENTNEETESSLLLKRIAEANFYLRVREKITDTILLNKSFMGAKTDCLKRYPLDSNDLTKSKKEQRSKKGGGIVKPVVISGVTGLIVYLFYSLRSR